MSERPKKKECSCSYDPITNELISAWGCECGAEIWNACIDAYEQWEKSQPKDAVSVEEFKIIARETAQKVYSYLNIDGIADSIAQAIHALITRKQPVKDAVSVDKEIIIDFINDVESGIKYLELNKQDYGYGKDRLRQKIATITRKLKGQDNEDKTNN